MQQTRPTFHMPGPKVSGYTSDNRCIYENTAYDEVSGAARLGGIIGGPIGGPIGGKVTYYEDPRHVAHRAYTANYRAREAGEPGAPAPQQTGRKRMPDDKVQPDALRMRAKREEQKQQKQQQQQAQQAKPM